ncbi:hypothetical protein KDL01_21480 [Actinospica durhamensis]|uniref:GP-PDE domain-containing protein n=1 Tax=Actinospica durhamensis TaxID=1508375 RepID=A0A941INW3_9ACTN|nr:glycerophosphodiester phosphodiesterase family protein [Actinospica durhamensis]MBR7835860.1 hypothetical protein [Actinospica durhamensis]
MHERLRGREWGAVWRRAVAGAAVALTLCGLSACAGSTEAVPTPRADPHQPRLAEPACDAPSVIAHRGETGDGRKLPENSAQAELTAAAEGATYLNLDVRWTGDAVPVALHDATVGRTTSDTDPGADVTSMTASQYTRLNARTYAGDTGQGSIVAALHPQTLVQILDAVAQTGRPVIVQMEGDPFHLAGHPVQEFANLARVVEHSAAAARIIVAGWTLPDLAAFHAADPHATLAYLFETVGARRYPQAAQIERVGARILYVDYRGVSAPLVTQWHRQGLKVWVWTPAGPAPWQRMRADGVDAIATDWAQAYLTWALPSRPCGAQF